MRTMSIPAPVTAPPWARAQPISVAVEPVALVVTECITITSAMRKHARWAHSSVSAILGGSSPSRLEALMPPPPNRKLSAPRKENGAAVPSRQATVADDKGPATRWGLRGKKGQSMQDNPLLSAFARLRNDLKQCKGMDTVAFCPGRCIAKRGQTYIPSMRLLSCIPSSKSYAHPLPPLRSPLLPS